VPEIVGQVGVRVVPDGSGFSPALQKLLDQAAGQAANAGTAIGRSMSNASRQSDELGASISALGSKFATAAVQAAGITASLFGVKAAVEGVIGKFSGMFDQLVQARKGFDSLIGSRQGGALIGEIQQFAKESPFVTQELVNYSQQLLGVGKSAESIVPLLKDTGNIIASVGGDTQNLGRVLYALTQIQTIGKLTGGDALQLQSSLIPITKLVADSLGKTTAEVKKMQEQGAISAEMVFDAIAKQGKNVEGAMDGAVNTISGAQAVLSDTIAIMKTSSPVLREIYDDMVKGIQLIAETLDSPEMQATITNILEGFGEVYEASKPVIASFAMFSEALGTSGLQVLGEVLGGIGTALNAIPTPVLTAFGAMLAGIVALKAPAMLLKYVENLRKLSSMFSVKGAGGLLDGLFGTKKGIDATGDAAARSTSKLKGYATALNQIRRESGVSAAASVVTRSDVKGAARSAVTSPYAGYAALAGAGFLGSALSNSSNSATTQQVGAGLTGAASGAAIGALAGPWGAAAGAAVGAVVGWMNKEEELAKAHKKKMVEIGTETATEYINTRTAEFGGFGGRDAALKELADLEAKRSQLKSKQFFAGAPVTEGEFAGKGYYQVEDKKVTDQLNQLDGEIKVYQEIRDRSLAQREALQEVISRLPQMRGGQEQLFTIEPLGGERFLKTNSEIIKDVEKLGLTVEEFFAKTGDEQLAIIKRWEGLSTAAQNATMDAVAYSNALTKARENAAGQYDVRLKGAQDNASQIAANDSALSGFNDATIAAMKDGATVAENAALAVSRLTLEKQIAINVELMYGDALSETERNARIAAEMTSANAVAQQKATMATSLAAIQTDAYASKLLNLSGVADTLENRSIAIDVALNNYEKVMAQLAALNELSALGAGGGGIGENQAGLRSDIYKKRLADILAGKDADGNDVVGLNATVRSQVAAAGAKSGGGGGGSSSAGPTGPTFEEQVASAGDNLKQSIEQAMQSVEQAADAWKSGIKEATQYETAVSASRALRNTNRQINDLNLINSGIATLKARGLSEDAIQALDINAITDARQIKKLLNSDPAQLQKISAAVAQRDAVAGQIGADRAREESRKTITEAIVAAAGLLGYKVTAEQAASISAEFNITSTVDSALVSDSILNKLTGGRANR
jgi:tape measure domain-containing protein